MLFIRNRQVPAIDLIKEELKRKKKKTVKNLTKDEKELIERIHQETQDLNLNNVTRTKAYFDFYKNYPSIHWAFLGHMVSRNGGWNMTDLKGDHLTRLLSKSERNDYFNFLERGNWLIFQDAYPQFLLYQESLKRNQPLFYLLPYMNISIFMETIWDYYWRYGEPGILTIGLIINEQSYLEQRMIQSPVYQTKVLNTLEFKLQDLLSFNHILFPYRKKQLMGLTLHQFGSLDERIRLGKRLYSLLFQNKDRLKQAVEWAKHHPHTGSRKDYWPHIFNNINEGIPGFPYQLRLQACKLRWGARRIYSPDLKSAWKNVQHHEAEKGDWYKHEQVADYLSEHQESINGEIEYEYCKTLERLELAALAKKVISILD